MKHLKKFEELDYTTYMSAADKLASYGQTDKAKELKKHALEMSRKFADEVNFGILVGGVREFTDAKFVSISIFKTSGNWMLRGLFKSGSLTHRVDSTVSESGQIIWKDGNKFLDKKSVVNYQKVIRELSLTQVDFEMFFKQTGLTSEDLTLVLRTFYL